jgi:glycosyltransferase involved in cell wall biosynthesis
MHADTFPKVSVLVATYNQEKFVRQALDSVFMQKTGFEFEVIIADDYSQDGTLRIAREYETAYPNVRILPTETHLGITRNFQRGFVACRGEYIAILEGDDYWISPTKLSSLSACLDQHPECAFCFHRVFRHDEISISTAAFPAFEVGNEFQSFTARELVQENFVGGFSTCVHRRELIARLDPRIWQLKVREWPFNIVVAQQGPVGYLPQIMSVYRVHPNGIWSLKTPEEHFAQFSEIIDPYNAFLDFKYDAEFQGFKRKYRQALKQRKKQKRRANSMSRPNSGGSRLRSWVKPFMPPILISVARRLFIRAD